MLGTIGYYLEKKINDSVPHVEWTPNLFITVLEGLGLEVARRGDRLRITDWGQEHAWGVYDLEQHASLLEEVPYRLGFSVLVACPGTIKVTWDHEIMRYRWLKSIPHLNMGNFPREIESYLLQRLGHSEQTREFNEPLAKVPGHRWDMDGSQVETVMVTVLASEFQAYLNFYLEGTQDYRMLFRQ